MSSTIYRGIDYYWSDYGLLDLYEHMQAIRNAPYIHSPTQVAAVNHVLAYLSRKLWKSGKSIFLYRKGLEGYFTPHLESIFRSNLSIIVKMILAKQKVYQDYIQLHGNINVNCYVVSILTNQFCNKLGFSLAIIQYRWYCNAL